MNKLKKYLRVNSVFSGFCGTSMLIFSNNLNLFFNIKNEHVFPVIGLNLIVFSIFVWFVSQKQLENKILVNLITGLDIIWVIISLIIIFLAPFDLSNNGNVLIVVVAVWIAFLAYKQFKNNF